jgi:beta-xylosidase
MLPLLSRRGLVVLALSALAAACADEPISTAALNPADPTGPEVSAGSRYRVYSGDFPDPYVLVDGSTYFAYATNSGGLNVPVLRSDDLLHWTAAGDALPNLPAWAEGGRKLTWAPSVLPLSSGYLLFFTARDHRSGRQCIGRAFGPGPAGPFSDGGSAPFICQDDLGGSIDPSVVRDSSGNGYLIWKSDGNCCGLPVKLWSQRLSPDGLNLVGTPVELLHPDQPWEGALIEGPTMWQDQGTWHLLYSANRWNSEQYATGYAVCASPLGPCDKSGQLPLLASEGEMAGPGGAEVFTDLAGRRWVAYHAWTAGHVGYRNGGARSLWIAAYPLRSEREVSRSTLLRGTAIALSTNSASRASPTPSTLMVMHLRPESSTTARVPGSQSASRARGRYRSRSPAANLP